MNAMEHCHVDAVEREPAEEEYRHLSEITLVVAGMGCPNCALRVRNALVLHHGVIDAQVDHMSGRAVIRYNPGLVAVDDLIQAVSMAGAGSHHQYAARAA